jgi:hypothetical protein
MTWFFSISTPNSIRFGRHGCPHVYIITANPVKGICPELLAWDTDLAVVWKWRYDVTVTIPHSKEVGYGEDSQDRLPMFFKAEPVPPHNVTFNVSDEDLDRVFAW